MRRLARASLQKSSLEQSEECSQKSSIEASETKPEPLAQGPYSLHHGGIQQGRLGGADREV